MICFKISTSKLEADIRSHGPDIIWGSTGSVSSPRARCYATLELTFVVTIEG